MPGTAVVDFWLSGWGAAATTTTYSVPTATLLLTADAPTLTLADVPVQQGGLVDFPPVRYLAETAKLRLYADSPRLSVSEVVQPEPTPVPAPKPRPRPRPISRTTFTATTATFTLHADPPTIQTTPLREREEEDALVLLGILDPVGSL